MSKGHISYNCPQCGGPAELDETHRVFRCSYCKTSLFLIPSDYLRYYIVPKNKIEGDIIYVPYWRLKGTAYSCVRSTVSKQLIERSYRAIDDAYLPLTLGYRTQTLDMRFISPEQENLLVKEKHLNRQYIYNVDEGDVFLPNMDPIYHRAFIGDCINIIYSPYLLRDNHLYDSVLNRKVEGFNEDSLASLTAMQRCKGWQVKFLPTLCPNCGWDLRGDGDTLVFPCTNCDSLWDISGGLPRRVSYYFMPSDRSDALYLPFWRLDVVFSNITIESYSDLFRIANLPKVHKKAWDEMKPYFWCPAFKVTPEVFLRLCKHLTLTEGGFDLKEHLDLGAVHSINLSYENAIEAVKITLANISSDRKNFYPRLQEIGVSIRDSAIVYIPFIASGSEFVNDRLRISIHKNTLKTGKRL